MCAVSDPPDKEALAEALRERIAASQSWIGVVGLGYVGLPVALTFVEAGFPVLGFDIDPVKVQMLGRGECYIHHLDGGQVRRAVESGRLQVTADMERLGEPDALVLCVPTPLTEHREPDLTYVERTAVRIGAVLRRGQLVVLESTTYPGTTDGFLRQTLESGSGLASGEDFFLAYSPEREDPGNRRFRTREIPKVVGGADPLSGDLAEALYGRAFQRVVAVSSSRVAEASKLTENVFRAVNIALVNELKVVYDRMGIDVWEVLDAAATKPFGFMRFDPGPGWGGHCIPLDPFYLSWKAREHKVVPRFIELAGEVNVSMPGYVVGKLQDALNARGKTVKGARVLVLGLAYKRDVADPRESPAFEVIDRLLELAAEVSYHDPHLPVAPPMRTWPDLPPMESVELTDQALSQADVVVIVTDHAAIDYERVARLGKLVVDTRGVYREGRENVVKA
jgi:UDP-N-acetyl-D-glucosamine dehydrogenase